MIKVYQWLQLPSKVTKKEDNDSTNENIERAKSTIWNKNQLHNKIKSTWINKMDNQSIQNES